MYALGIVQSQASGNLLLDAYPNAVLAYSLRKLRSGYNGSAIRVRRSSDNTEKDIGFVVSGSGIGGTQYVLDQDSLTTFVGNGVGNHGYISTWYDQSTTRKNLTAVTTNRQPAIVVSGSLLTQNLKPTINFDGLASALYNSSVTLSTYMMVFLVAKCDDVAKPFIIEHSINANNNDGFFFYGDTNSAWLVRRSASVHRAVGTNDWSGTNQFIGTFIYNPTQQRYALNDTLQANGTVVGTLRANSNVTAPFHAFNRANNSIFFDGKAQELVIFQQTNSENRGQILQNMNSFYKVF